MITEIEAIIFDMDGVIVDTEYLHIKAADRACRAYDITVPRSVWYQFVGKPDKAAFAHVVKTLTDGTVVTSETLAALKDRHYSALLTDHIRPVPGALDFIRSARPRFRMGLATSGIRQDQARVFELLGLNGLFDAVITVEDVVNGKPHPEPYLRAAERLGVLPAKSLVIEDAVNGIYAAKAAGCKAVGITTSFPPDVLRKAGADAVVDGFEALFTALGFSDRCLADDKKK
ncbi:HAD family phosphatase [Desulfonema ishimotonii]|uniref:HAD family phosphatase n=1 Tax=Desulfonema ishimotonii TaxID=45657 RepID=A0A401G3T4_9BACT|nr:HAD family phosphatase [Desulfonema ishimotonii]GBC63841.1 HAD family phosphatase [Desulfonema ishimotonii]